MGEAIGPGDWVECIAVGHNRRISLGHIYQVSGWGLPGVPCGLCGGCKTVRLSGVNGDDHRGYCVTRFRPIYSPKSELIESLLRKANEPIREDA